MMKSTFFAGLTALALSASAAGGSGAAEYRLDLRNASSGLPRTTIAAPQPSEAGVLRRNDLRAGAATLPALKVGDTVALTVFDDVELSVVLKERLESPLGGESFTATLEGYDGFVNVVVVQTPEGLQVDVQDFMNSRVYSVVSSAEKTSVSEIDTKAVTVTPTDPLVPDERMLAEDTTPRAPSATAAVSEQSDTLVDILIAYDSNAAAWAKASGGGLQNFALTTVAKMNTALANSGLDANFRFRLVGTTELSVSKKSVHDALYAVDDNESGWGAVKTKREEVGADIVTVLIDTGSAAGTTGVGWALEREDLASFAGAAYNCCAIRAVARGHTMTHEVGHNMGAGHATAVNPAEITPGPQQYDYSAAYHFTGNDGKKYYTIMAYSFDGFGNSYEPAPVFSSPLVKWQGVSAGDETHDNVRTLRATFTAASLWRAQQVPLSYDVFFSPEAGALFDDSVTVTLTPGKTGLQIRYTTDGSEPTLTSQIYSSPLVITRTTTVKAAAVCNGVLGPVHEARYLKKDLAVALNAPDYDWTTGSAEPWVPQSDVSTYDGFAAQSSPDLEWGSSWLKTTVKDVKKMSFRYQVCQAEAAFKVYCDGKAVWSDTEDSWSLGKAYDWKFVEIDLAEGTHEIKFAFELGYSTWTGMFNGVVLDTVEFEPATPARKETAAGVPYSWLDEQFAASGTRTPEQYEVLEGNDADGDGFTNGEEYFCGTDPKDARLDEVPRCTIRIVNGSPQIGSNISIPEAAAAAGWESVTQGSTDLVNWSAADKSAHRFFRILVRRK